MIFNYLLITFDQEDQLRKEKKKKKKQNNLLYIREQLDRVSNLA
jgi:hypothetical protein